MSLVSLKFQQFPLFSLLWALDQITVRVSLKISPIQCIWYIFAVYIVYSTVYMVYFIFYSVHGIFYSVNIISTVYMVYFTV